MYIYQTIDRRATGQTVDRYTSFLCNSEASKQIIPLKSLYRFLNLIHKMFTTQYMRNLQLINKLCMYTEKFSKK